MIRSDRPESSRCRSLSFEEIAERQGIRGKSARESLRIVSDEIRRGRVVLVAEDATPERRTPRATCGTRSSGSDIADDRG